MSTAPVTGLGIIPAIAQVVSQKGAEEADERVWYGECSTLFSPPFPLKPEQRQKREAMDRT